TQFNAITLNSAPSGNTFAQWYPVDQSVSVSGFDFFAWQSAGTSAVITLTCKMFIAGPDSMPSGLALASTTVTVDSTFGAGLLSGLLKQAKFSLPVTVTAAYVVTVETSSPTNVSVISNNWSAVPPNGRNEWLSSVKINNNFIRGYNINVGTAVFNADFMFLPYVSYNMDANFTISACNNASNQITFTNTSSPVLFNKFYNLRAFYNIAYTSCIWDYGDTSGLYYTIDGTKMYNNSIPYSVSLKDTLYGWRVGCVDVETKTVGVSPPPPAATSNSPLCSGATLTLHADTIAGATYYWTGPNGFTSTQQNPSLSNIGITAIGTYLARAIISGCTSAVASTYVNVITSLSASSNAPLCAGQTLNLSINQIAGAVYSWTGPNGFTSSQHSPSVLGATVADSGLYRVTVSLAGCGTLGPYSIVAPVNRVPVTPVAGSNGPLCAGDNLNLTSTPYPGGTYTWSGPNSYISTQQNPTRSSAQSSFAGTYSVSVLVNGCTSQAGSVTVTINNVPTTPTAGNNGPLCSGQSLSLTASAIAGATYAWSGPNGFTSTTQNPTRTSLTTLDAGSYSVIATVSGCASLSANTSVVITNATPTPVVSTNGPLCPGQSLQLSASAISGATYSWTGPNSFTSSSQNPTINSVALGDAGIYSVTAITSGCGISSAGSATLVINTLPGAPTVGNNGPLCDGSSINLTASSITGATYTWTGVNGFTSSLQNPVIPNGNSAHAGDYTVYVSVTGCGNSPVSTTNVKLNRIPSTPSANSNGSICVGDSIKLFGSAINVGPNATYKWTGPNNYSSSNMNAVIVNTNTSNAGSYDLVVTDSNCASAPSSTSITVKLIPSAPVASSNSPLCAGATVLLTSSTISGATYEWSGANDYKSNSKNPVILNSSVNTSGSYEVISIVNGCRSIPASTTVLVNALPDKPTVMDSIMKCDNESVNLTAQSSPGVSYSWSGPAGFASLLQNPSISGLKQNNAGNYQVIATSSLCASLPAVTKLIVNEFPAAPVLSTSPSSGQACSGDTLQLFATFLTNATYQWSGPGGFGSSVQRPVLYALTPANSGQYSATVTRFGCTSLAGTVNFTVNPIPVTGDIDGPEEAIRDQTHTYTVAGPLTSIYTWTVSTGGAILSGATTSTVNVKWSVATSAATIKVFETNVGGCKGAVKSLTFVVKKPGVGLNDVAFNAGAISIYPNPSTKFATLAFDLNKAEHATIRFTNVLGQEVLKDTRQVQQKEDVLYDVSMLNKGIYLVNIEINGEYKTMKLLVE
ncbi:MAG: T9SS type A sorting domain-containing protein, partial [Bacteroidota bacterium]